MIDIGVSMDEKVLKHKRRDGRTRYRMERFGAMQVVERRYCFWTMPFIPKDVRRGSRLWVASGGRWRGYFVVQSVIMHEGPPSAVEPGGELRFHSESWVGYEDGPRRPFRGFTYKVPPKETTA